MSKKRCIKCGEIMEEDHCVDEGTYIYSYRWECSCGVEYFYFDKEGTWFDKDDKEIV